MTDHFTELGVPRRPWLDEESLKARFHARSADLHPDKAGGDAEAFSRLNSAYTTLRDPALRIRHLLELEYPELLPTRETAIPENVADVFMRVGELRRRLHHFRQREEKGTSPIVRALLAPEKMELVDQATEAVGDLSRRRDGALTQIAAIDREWRPGDPEFAKSLAFLYHQLAFFSRWLDQIRGEMMRLEFGSL